MKFLLHALVSVVIGGVLAVSAYFTNLEWATLMGIAMIIARDIVVDAR